MKKFIYSKHIHIPYSWNIFQKPEYVRCRSQRRVLISLIYYLYLYCSHGKKNGRFDIRTDWNSISYSKLIQRYILEVECKKVGDICVPLPSNLVIYKSKTNLCIFQHERVPVYQSLSLYDTSTVYDAIVGLDLVPHLINAMATKDPVKVIIINTRKTWMVNCYM